MHFPKNTNPGDAHELLAGQDGHAIEHARTDGDIDNLRDNWIGRPRLETFAAGAGVRRLLSIHTVISPLAISPVLYCAQFLTR
ncbi:hypothetical protein D8B25_14140 [Verminephrobacter aporrectodeae subsp. tuberculatae]|nr:hypothetical protein [Verminephrobacter aporrectodeae subsp. tuberculatae]MCW8204165.1 hypothetical protein [Verminephrobacter aporrectodeae subsp. tuberculatae]